MLDDFLSKLVSKNRKRTEWIVSLGNLLESYKKQKISFKETKFTLFDLANFIHDHITTSEDNEKLFYLLNKYRKLKNKERGFPKENMLNAKELFEMGELDETFGIICESSNREIVIIQVNFFWRVLIFRRNSWKIWRIMK
jgi:hypothetical protein